MCGICGKISLNSKVDEALIKRMCSVLAHRGPDDEGVKLLGESDSHRVNILRSGRKAGNREVNIGLGHRRLAIIDLSPAGRVKMFARTILIIFGIGACLVLRPSYSFSIQVDIQDISDNKYFTAVHEEILRARDSIYIAMYEISIDP